MTDEQYRILGDLRSADGTGTVRMRDRFDTDIDDLWAALTDAHRLARWLGEFQGDLRIGGEFRAHFFATGWEGTGHVDVCEAPNRLRVTTRDVGSADDHVVEALLSVEGDHTVLVIAEHGIRPDQLANYGAGIQVHVEDLAAYLAGDERCHAEARWKELLPAYQDLAAEVS